MPDTPTARLSLSHATVAVRDLDAMLDFYCGVLGFAVTNRGTVGEGEMAFISQDPSEHHQMVFVSGMPETEHQFVMADHMAFRTGSLDDLRRSAPNSTRPGSRASSRSTTAMRGRCTSTTRKATASSVSSTAPSTLRNRSPMRSI